MVALNPHFTPTYDLNKNTKMKGHDRLFVLKLIDENAPVSSTGLVDKRLFTGENRLHALRDESSDWLWYFKYDHGPVPSDLKDRRYTRFELAKDFAEMYFRDRNIKIEEIVD